MKNNLKKIQLLLSIIFLALFILAFWFLYGQINRSNQKAEQTLADIETTAKEREEVNMLDRSIESIDRDRVDLETHFAGSSDIVPFLDAIETRAIAAGIGAEVASVDISNNNTVLTITVNTSGSFAKLYRFLQLLENFPYQLEISSMNMQKQPAGAVTAVGADGQVVAVVPAAEPKWQATFKIKLLSFVP